MLLPFLIHFQMMIHGHPASHSSSPVQSESLSQTLPVSRASRLRGLASIRSYTHSHFRPTSPTNPSTTQHHTSLVAPPLLTRADTHPAPTSNNIPIAASSNHLQHSITGWLPALPNPNLTRPSAQTHSPPTTTTSRSPVVAENLRYWAENARESATSNRTNTTTMSDSAHASSQHNMPTIQLMPATEQNRSRQSLEFPNIVRTLPYHSSIIRVGRYSERDSSTEAQPIKPSDAPIGFKSKVVSRRHCEFTCTDGQWFVRDVRSSSGTFLNHIRLSQPGVESRLYPVNDGDVIQLGIDFKGGEEMIFRCVKIRIETNRGWQRAPNKFK